MNLSCNPKSFLFPAVPTCSPHCAKTSGAQNQNQKCEAWGLCLERVTHLGINISRPSCQEPRRMSFSENVLWKQIKATCLLYCCSFLFINIFYVSDFKININLLEKNWKVEERKFKYSHSSVIITIDTSGNFRSIVLFLNRNLVVVVVYLVA